MDQLREIFSGDIPPWVKRFVKSVGRGMSHFDMIQDGDTVILGISGGKDSLAMAMALALRLKWLPIKYYLKAIQIEWAEFPMKAEQRGKMTEYFDILGIEYTVLTETMWPGDYKESFNCYRCARNRKRLLFDKAKELGASKIAFGHHMDDIVETTLMNMAFHGNFSTMMPVQEFFGGEIQVIRPMCEVPEKDVIRVRDRLNIPVFHSDCPFKETNMRASIKPIVASFMKLNKHALGNLYKTPWNICREYLPGE